MGNYHILLGVLGLRFRVRGLVRRLVMGMMRVTIWVMGFIRATY